ncbi:agarase [Amycolatopsis pithecellobii]|uniref:Agarase n=1 Tax=Amycolatopsis pithecellobii TaxID=664692 RepID=A0A6N7YZT5_9PSEU|nr:agarase [Amycolatopsis pithecellobii]MTD52614.1 agarase [Amycolatopsis pithecellobii]
MGFESTKLRKVAGFFGVARNGARWSFMDPRGAPFFSLGVNHADESNLKYPSNIEIWRRRYGSRAAWITNGVVRDLDAWGFNTIGWTSECVALGEVTVNDYEAPYDAKHSKPWEITDFAIAGRPYCIALPVAPIEGWNLNPVFPDVFSREWEEWCAYLARSLVADFADDPHLIGYFFVDIPSWTSHPSGAYFPGVERGDETGLAAVANRYYQTIHDAIRAYDQNHLILGDRYNGNAGIPDVVLDAMAGYVDVLSVQYFPDASAEGRCQMRDDLARWHRRCGKPVLIADIGNWCATAHNPQRVSELADQRARAEDYVAAFDAVLDGPWLIGWHWCSYLENYSRGWGLKSPEDDAYDDLVAPIKEFNASVPDRRLSVS